MKISLCITVLNEQDSIEKLLESIVHQARIPDEVIIVDGGSTDKTVSRIKYKVLGIKNISFKILVKRGNRSVGRNEAIRQSKGDIIAITDAGCELDNKWLEEIVKPFEDIKTQVVSGYYEGKPQNAFEASLVPYVLVMPDKVKKSSFLPATRSMAMRKEVWERLGKFPEQFRWNEDYIFSKNIEKAHIPIIFAPHAIVYWFPQKTLKASFWMFYAFAKGDAQAGIFRPKVMLLLLRISMVLVAIVYALVVHQWIIFEILVILFVLYSIWAIQKNYRYIQQPAAFFWLPVLQYTSDIAISIGTVKGCWDRLFLTLPKIF